MKPVTDFEPLSREMAVKISQAGWPVVGAIDVEFGAATVDKTCKAVWTIKGNRVEVSMGGGALVVSQSKDVDPIYTERKTKIQGQ
jgi:hypothetical protein